MNILTLYALEKRKTNYKRNFLIVLCVSIGVFIFSLVTFTADYGDYTEFCNYYSVVNNAQMYNKWAWTIYATIMFAILYGDEFVSRSIYVLFTYPISRLRIGMAKYLYVFVSTFVFYVISSTVHIILLLLLNTRLNFITSEVDLTQYRLIVLSIVLNGLSIFCISCIPFLVNIITKSSKASVVVAIILCLLLYQAGSFSHFIGTENLKDLRVAIIGISGAIIGMRKLVTQDV